MSKAGQESILTEIHENAKQDKQGPITQELLDNICKKIHPCSCLKLESCHHYNRLMDEPDSWSVSDIAHLKDYLEIGYGPFFDMLFSGRKGMTKYLILRAYLVRKSEIEKVNADYEWRCETIPKIFIVACVVGVVSLCGFGAFVSVSYIASRIEKVLSKRK